MQSIFNTSHVNIGPVLRLDYSSNKCDKFVVSLHLAKIKAHNGISGDKKGKDCTHAAIEVPENSIHSLVDCIVQGPGCKDIFSSEQ